MQLFTVKLRNEPGTLAKVAEALAQRGVTCGAFVANSLVSEANHFDQGFETFDGLNWANTREVGRIRVTGYESKGRINKRIRIELVDP